MNRDLALGIAKWCLPVGAVLFCLALLLSCAWLFARCMDAIQVWRGRARELRGAAPPSLRSVQRAAGRHSDEFAAVPETRRYLP